MTSRTNGWKPFKYRSDRNSGLFLLWMHKKYIKSRHCAFIKKIAIGMFRGIGMFSSIWWQKASLHDLLQFKTMFSLFLFNFNGMMYFSSLEMEWNGWSTRVINCWMISMKNSNVLRWSIGTSLGSVLNKWNSWIYMRRSSGIISNAKYHLQSIIHASDLFVLYQTQNDFHLSQESSCFIGSNAALDSNQNNK